MIIVSGIRYINVIILVYLHPKNVIREIKTKR